MKLPPKGGEVAEWEDAQDAGWEMDSGETFVSWKVFSQVEAPAGRCADILAVLCCNGRIVGSQHLSRPGRWGVIVADILPQGCLGKASG